MTRLMIAFVVWAGCSLVPLKPLVPLGCRDVVPVCSCDSRGEQCQYLWVCVK